MFGKLAIGRNLLFEVRTAVHHYPVAAPFSILYLSDLHFNQNSGTMVTALLAKIETLNPDLILLGGDYADSKKGLACFRLLMDGLAHHNHVLAAAGNHDEWLGAEKCKAIVEAAGAVWIEKKSVSRMVNNNLIWVDGNTATTRTAAGLRILNRHNPAGISRCSNAYDLIFAGHLHGGQVVLWQTANGLYPGRFFYRWNRLSATLGDCRIFISKGLGDTLPIRYNCKKEMVFVHIKPLQTE